MAEDSIDPRELSLALWRDVAARKRETDEDMPALPPPVHVRHDEGLGWLNRGYVFPVPDPEGLGRAGGLRGKIRQMAARLLLTVLGDYFVEERRFLERLVQFQNELAKRNDELLEEIRLVDRGVRAALARLAERDDHLHARLEGRLADLERFVEGGGRS